MARRRASPSGCGMGCGGYGAGGRSRRGSRSAGRRVRARSNARVEGGTSHQGRGPPAGASCERRCERPRDCEWGAGAPRERLCVARGGVGVCSTRRARRALPLACPRASRVPEHLGQPLLTADSRSLHSRSPASSSRASRPRRRMRRGSSRSDSPQFALQPQFEGCGRPQLGCRGTKPTLD